MNVKAYLGYGNKIYLFKSSSDLPKLKTVFQGTEKECLHFIRKNQHRKSPSDWEEFSVDGSKEN